MTSSCYTRVFITKDGRGSVTFMCIASFACHLIYLSLGKMKTTPVLWSCDTVNKILINSSPPSAAYMRQWIRSASVQTMACRLFGAKPLSEPLLGYCQLDPKEQTSAEWNFNQNTKHFIHENTCDDIVCEMAPILSRGGWVKDSIWKYNEVSLVLS